MSDDVYATETGSITDMARRLRMTLPNGWFPTSPPSPSASLTPVLDGVLAGLGAAWSFCFGLLRFVTSQARLGTAFSVFLDLISADFFGDALPRQGGEADASFRGRISQNLVSNRATRAAVVQAVCSSGLSSPFIVEPSRATDCGSYGSGSGGPVASAGYGTTACRYGSPLLPFQYMLQVTAASSFASGLTCGRQSPATFIDPSGVMQIVAAGVLRPMVVGGVVQGPLIEKRSFNLIRDSRGWNWLDFLTPPTGTTWVIESAKTGLLPGDATLMINVAAAAAPNGAHVDVAAGGLTVTGSIWLLLPVGSSVSSAQLVLSDLTSGTRAVVNADLGITGQWQRLVLTGPIAMAPGRTARLGLEIESSTAAAVQTQCWQIEPGAVASSYIPTAGGFGIRAEDIVTVSQSPSSSVVLAEQQVLQAISSAIPAATVAWCTYSVAA